MKRKLYVLTDGTNLFDTRYMSDEEKDTAQNETAERTDGNVYWEEVRTPIPNVENIL